MTENGNEGATHEAAEGEVEAPQIDLGAVQKEWADKIEKAEKARANFRNEAERAVKWLRLDKNGRKAKANGDKLNIAWANYEILQQSTYARAPKPVVVPRFGGGNKRDLLNGVAQVVERSVEANAERAELHDELLLVRDSLLKAGIGQVWVRYEPTFEQQPVPMMDPMTGAPMIGLDGKPVTEMQDVKTDERVVADYVAWDDYLEGPADTWAKVPWVARRVRMDKKAFAKRFGDDRAMQAGVGFSEESEMATKRGQAPDGSSAGVWEIWCRDSRKVYFIVRDAEQAIEVTAPFLTFDGFYPCPKPAMALFEDGSRIPVPPILMIEDQLVEVDALTKRINALRDGLRVRGFYGKGATATTAADEIESAVKMTDDRTVLVPVSAWAVSGKSDLGIVWLPIDMVVAVVRECTAMRKEAIELIYQVTGISDVMRGASEASETLGAQQIKAQWGSIRVQSLQGEMTRVARDVMRLTAEVICEVFDPQNIAQLAVYGFNPDMMELLRQDRMRPMLLDVETDSTIQPDEDADKKRRTEFATAIGGLVQQAVPLVQQAPEMLGAVASIVKFVAAGFRSGRELEGEIEKAFTALQQRVGMQQQTAMMMQPGMPMETGMEGQPMPEVMQ